MCGCTCNRWVQVALRANIYTQISKCACQQPQNCKWQIPAVQKKTANAKRRNNWPCGPGSNAIARKFPQRIKRGDAGGARRRLACFASRRSGMEGAAGSESSIMPSLAKDTTGSSSMPSLAKVTTVDGTLCYAHSSKVRASMAASKLSNRSRSDATQCH